MNKIIFFLFFIYLRSVDVKKLGKYILPLKFRDFPGILQVSRETENIFNLGNRGKVFSGKEN